VTTLLLLLLFLSYASCDEEVIDKGYNGYYLSDPGSHFPSYLSPSSPRRSILTLSAPSAPSLAATPGKETSQASDPKLGTALWELSERMVKEVVGEDALLPWTETSAWERKDRTLFR
jgi:hypothetical protein